MNIDPKSCPRMTKRHAHSSKQQKFPHCAMHKHSVIATSKLANNTNKGKKVPSSFLSLPLTLPSSNIAHSFVQKILEAILSLGKNNTIQIQYVTNG